LACGEEVQNHTAEINMAATTLAAIRPNALRMFTLSTHSNDDRRLRWMSVTERLPIFDPAAASCVFVINEK
jgi:hypothetical protein